MKNPSKKQKNNKNIDKYIFKHPLMLITEEGTKKIDEYYDFCKLMKININKEELKNIVNQNIVCFECSEKIKEETAVIYPYINNNEITYIYICINCFKNKGN